MAPTQNLPLQQRLWAIPGLRIWFIPTLVLLLFLLVALLTKSGVEALLSSQTVSQCDTMVREWFRSHSSSQLDLFVQTFALLGSPVAMLVYALIGLNMLRTRQQWSLLYMWDVTFIGLWVLTSLLKRVYHRRASAGRPGVPVLAVVQLSERSFLGAMVAFGMIAYVLATVVYKDRDQRAVLWIVAPLLILAVGISRLYLGVHYLSEVVAGFMVGGGWLALCLWSHKRFGQPAALRK